MKRGVEYEKRGREKVRNNSRMDLWLNEETKYGTGGDGGSGTQRASTKGTLEIIIILPSYSVPPYLFPKGNYVILC